jgi:RNA polymerase sigma factor (sigma-70 family)
VSGGAALQIASAPERDAPTDNDLVAAVRRGDETAFTELYARYQRRVHAYVLGMVKDHGRAEDVTQEVFISAYRRMRETERPIAFKPWVYEIARNACIDAFRRGKRAEEVSFDADDDLRGVDQSRLQSGAPTPDAQIDAKQRLHHLCGAFGGLSETHHRILVMRELEGLSYREIGERLGMSRPAVESTLFRARRRLTEEYEELASGERCLRVHAIIAASAEGMLGARDQRRLARHVAHCQPCRRHAVASGLDIAALTRKTRREALAEKIAGFLPFPLPAFLRLRNGAESAAAVAGSNAEPIAGWGKAVAALATLVLAGAGAGVGTQVARDDDRAPGTRGAAPAADRDPAPAGAASPGIREARRPAAVQRREAGATGRRERSRRAERRGGDTGGGAPGAARDLPRGTSPGDGSAPASGQSPASRGGGGDPSRPQSDTRRSAVPSLPDPVQALRDTSSGAGNTVSGVGDTVSGVGQGVGDTVSGVGQGIGDTVSGVGQGVGETVSGAGQGVGDTVGGVGQTVQGVGQRVPGPVGDTVSGVGQTVQGVGSAAGSATNQVGSTVGSAGQAAGSVTERATGVVGGAVQGLTGGRGG